MTKKLLCDQTLFLRRVAGSGAVAKLSCKASPASRYSWSRSMSRGRPSLTASRKTEAVETPRASASLRATSTSPEMRFSVVVNLPVNLGCAMEFSKYLRHSISHVKAIDNDKIHKTVYEIVYAIRWYVPITLALASAW